MKNFIYMIFIIIALAAAIITNSCGGSASLPGTDNDLPPDSGNEQTTNPGGGDTLPGESSDDLDGDGIPDGEDPDGDGFTGEGGDCNDLDPDTYPGAPEQPDDPGYIDTNCDGIDGDLVGAYWVSTDGNDANPGTIDEPFATIQMGIDSAAVDPSAVLDVYVVGGNYNQDGILSAGVGLYGGFGPLDGGLRQRDIELYESVNTIKTTSFWVAGPSDSAIEGITFKGIADTATILIVNTSPTLRHNKIYSAESHISSIAVGILAIGDDTAAKPNFLANLIVADDIDPLEVSGVSTGDRL